VEKDATRKYRPKKIGRRWSLFCVFKGLGFELISISSPSLSGIAWHNSLPPAALVWQHRDDAQAASLFV
jgi:hypothetical protein